MNYDSILKRMEKAIKKVDAMGNGSNIHIIESDVCHESLVGLVIILDQSNLDDRQVAA